jgi:hypothetical protein
MGDKEIVFRNDLKGAADYQLVALFFFNGS